MPPLNSCPSCHMFGSYGMVSVYYGSVSYTPTSMITPPLPPPPAKPVGLEEAVKEDVSQILVDVADYLVVCALDAEKMSDATERAQTFRDVAEWLTETKIPEVMK